MGPQLSPGCCGVRLGSRQRVALRDGCRLLCQREGMRPRELSRWQGKRCSWTDVSSHPGATALAATLPRASGSSTLSPGGHETRALVPGGWEGGRDRDGTGTEEAGPPLASGGCSTVSLQRASAPLPSP